jgi:rhodanese-related sulfurtransferase
MSEEILKEEKNPKCKKILAIAIVIAIILGVFCVTLYFSNKRVQAITVYDPVQMRYFMNHSCKCIPIIDVRTPEEYATSHINRSVNINWKYENFTQLISVYNRDNPIIVYCGIGARSHNASLLMKDLGFKYIYDLKGGLTAWVAAGYPVVGGV